MTTTLEKIAALLRKAESTTPEEAEALVSKAQQLATLAAIDLATAREYVPEHERKETPTQKMIIIGEAGKKALATYVNLFLKIADANDVRCTIAYNLTYVNAYGFPSDIANCEALFASLLTQMVEASNAYIKKGEYKSETYFSHSTWTHKKMDGRIARRSFQEGFATRVGQRLSEARKQAVDDAETRYRAAHQPVGMLPEASQETQSDSVALVLVRKSEEVNRYFSSNNNARRLWKGGSGSASSNASRSAGRSAGDRARLGAPRGLKA